MAPLVLSNIKAFRLAAAYYVGVLWSALKMVKEGNDRLASLVALVVVTLPLHWRGWLSDRLPSWPWWVSLLLWVGIMMVRANWHEVQSRDQRITLLEHRVAQAYHVLLDYIESGWPFLQVKVGKEEVPASNERVHEWMQAMERDLKPLLSRHYWDQIKNFTIRSDTPLEYAAYPDVPGHQTTLQVLRYRIDRMKEIAEEIDRDAKRLKIEGLGPT